MLGLSQGKERRLTAGFMGYVAVVCLILSEADCQSKEQKQKSTTKKAKQQE